MTAVAADSAAARRTLRRLVKSGGLLIPAHSPFGRISFEFMEALLEDGKLQSCNHLAEHKRIDPSFVPTYPPQPFVVVCASCFSDDPVPAFCQVCLTPTPPGLRTVITRDPANSGIRFVGRLCRDCRPGRVA